MGRTSSDDASVAKKKQRDHQPHVNEPRHSIARATLVAGGGFGTTIATLLGLAGRWNLGDTIVLWAIAAVCLVVALTLFVVAYLTHQ
jgi:hypothetical protein